MRTSVYIASDHAGFELKEHLKEYLIKKGVHVEDYGPSEYDETDDYPDTIRPLVEAIATKKDIYGIIIGGSGQGEAMVANRLKGIRAAVSGADTKLVSLARKHNDANILSLGARLLSVQGAENLVDIFLNTPFSADERHIRRIRKF